MTRDEEFKLIVNIIVNCTDLTKDSTKLFSQESNGNVRAIIEILTSANELLENFNNKIKEENNKLIAEFGVEV